MSHLTYNRILSICSEYSGHEDLNSDANKRFAHRVLERMFYRGKHGSLVSLSLCATAGCITLPEDVEHVEKVKINGKTGSVFSHWYSFSNAATREFYANPTGIRHLPNRFYTQYEPPSRPFNVVIKSRSDREDSSSFITVHGVDIAGKDITSRYNGETLQGESLPLINNKRTAGTLNFNKITGIEKTKTKDYVDLYARDPITKEMTLLSSYSPKEKNPSYTRIEISGCEASSIYSVDILARLRILQNYDCNEYIPVVGVDVLETICQEIRSMKDSNFNDSIAAGKVAENLIRNENNYKYGNNQDTMDIVDMSYEDPGDVW